MKLLLVLALLLAAVDGLAFGGDTYHLADLQRAPDGRELREYLLEGETFDDYSKMTALRREAPLPLADFATVMKQGVQEKYPGASFQVLHLDEQVLEMKFVLGRGDEREYNLWRYVQTGERLSFQFVFRPRGRYAGKAFDEEVARREAQWIREMRKVKVLEPEGSAGGPPGSANL